MHYLRVWLRSAPECFTWHTNIHLGVGARVEVNLRGKPHRGIVVSVSTKQPPFATHSINRVLDVHCVHPHSIALAEWTSHVFRASLGQVMSLIIPKLWTDRDTPVEPEKHLTLTQPDATLRGAKQKAVLEALQAAGGTLPWSAVTAVASSTTIKSLLDKDILALSSAPETNHAPPKAYPPLPYGLRPQQAEALNTILKSEKPTLLWGVTGSGKTAVYIEAMRALLQQNPEGQCLFLLPEIALTPQLEDRIRRVFGPTVGVWHSRLAEGEKARTWQRAQRGELRVLVGARSALWVPMKSLSAIIMDEEHEWTYKNEQNPRYETHAVAAYLAQKWGAKLIMGSATPRVESYARAKAGAWTLARLRDRITGTPLPRIDLVDLRDEWKQNPDAVISQRLQSELQRVVDSGEQAVLLLNKRGLFQSMLCRHCGQRPECPHCSMTMKLHKKGTKHWLMCHLCGHTQAFTNTCPQCNKSDYLSSGWGTQHAEAWLKEHMPALRVLRADADTMTKKNAFDDMRKAFDAHEVDVLLGTQMIAKGLDFDRVNLVGVLNADVGLSLPDIRAEERVFQLLVQVAGRAGRRQKPGKVIIQTLQKENRVFRHARLQNVEAFLEEELKARKAHKFPPFSLLCKCVFTHEDKSTALKHAKTWAAYVREHSDFTVYLAPAFIPRQHGHYHLHVVIQSPKLLPLLHWLDRHQHKAPDGMKLDMMPSSVL